MLVPVGEEREHFGYDAIRDKKVEDKKKPLYVFRFYPDEGLLKKYEVKNYDVFYEAQSKVYCYIFAGSAIKTHEHNLDKLIHNKVVSFDPSYEKAKDIVEAAIEQRGIKAYNEYKMFSSILDRLMHNSKNKEEQ